MSKPILYNTLELHHDAKILLVSDNYKLRLLLTIHKIYYDKAKVPDELKNCFALNTDLHQYPTRTRQNIFLTATSFSKIRKVIDAAAITWNELPDSLKDIQRRDTFKNKVKNHFLSMYK